MFLHCHQLCLQSKKGWILFKYHTLQALIKQRIVLGLNKALECSNLHAHLILLQYPNFDAKFHACQCFRRNLCFLQVFESAQLWHLDHVLILQSLQWCWIGLLKGEIPFFVILFSIYSVIVRIMKFWTCSVTLSLREWKIIVYTSFHIYEYLEKSLFLIFAVHISSFAM